jgi:hypothetical protein
MALPWRFTLDVGPAHYFMRYTFVVEGTEFTVYGELFKDGASLLGHPSRELDATWNGKRARVVDYNWGSMDDRDARQFCAWCVSQLRARSGEEFAARRQIALPGVAR